MWLLVMYLYSSADVKRITELIPRTKGVLTRHAMMSGEGVLKSIFTLDIYISIYRHTLSIYIYIYIYRQYVRKLQFDFP